MMTLFLPLLTAFPYAIEYIYTHTHTKTYKHIYIYIYSFQPIFINILSIICCKQFPQDGPYRVVQVGNSETAWNTMSAIPQ